MTKAELLDIALGLGLDVPSKATKQDILDFIEEV